MTKTRRTGQSQGIVSAFNDLIAPKDPRVTGEECKFDDAGATATLETKSTQIKTPEQAIAKAKLDMRLWEIDRQVVNSWEVAAWDKEQHKFRVQPLWQVKLWLKRRIAKRLVDAVDIIREKMGRYRPKPLKIKYDSGPVLLEHAPYDIHYGKYAWGLETGSDYDSDLAQRIQVNASHDTLARCRGFKIGSILIPIGNDWFNANNWAGETAKGTRQDMDTRYTRVFEKGFWGAVQSIDAFRQVAPVKVIWVPGNHDPETSFHLLFCLSLMYRNVESVEIDLLPTTRKYVVHGINLLGFTHGDEEKHRDLPTIMASEVPELWGKSKCREIHCAHLHKAKETVHVTSDEFGGTRVRILPSLSGRDFWHYKQGYISRRAAESYLWDADSGYVAHVSSNARER